jgi:hypothetical protein
LFANSRAQPGWALGGDPGRVLVQHRRDAADDEPLQLPADADLLDAAVAATGARLVVIDPIMAFLEPAVATGSDHAVRRSLAPLAQLAERRECTILLVRHLTKAGGRRCIYRGTGSIGLIAACRAAWLAARDPDDSGCCVLAQVNNNLAPPHDL